MADHSPHDFVIKRRNEVTNIVKIIQTLLPPGKALESLDATDIGNLLKGRFDTIAKDFDLLTDVVQNIQTGGLQGDVATHYHVSDRDLANSGGELPLARNTIAVQTHISANGNPHNTTISQLNDLDCQNKNITNLGDAINDGDAINLKVLKNNAIFKTGNQSIDGQKTFTSFPEASGTGTPPTPRSLVTRDFIDNAITTVNATISGLGITATGDVASHYHSSDRNLANATGTLPLLLQSPEVQNHLAATNANPHGISISQLTSLDCGGRTLTGLGTATKNSDAINLGDLPTHAVSLTGDQSVAGQKIFTQFPRIAGLSSPSHPRDIITLDHLNIVETNINAAISTTINTAVSGVIHSSEKGAPNGVCALDANGKVSSTQLDATLQIGNGLTVVAGMLSLDFGTGTTQVAAGSHSHNASQIPFTPAGGLSSTNVQQALVELTTISGGGSLLSGDISTHYHSSDRNLANAIGTLPLSRTDLDAKGQVIANVADPVLANDAVNLSTLNTKLSTISPNGNALQISFSPTGNIAATDVQQAIAELDAEKSTIGHTHTQSETHNSPDTDAALNALHHTIGMGANQAAAGNHNHNGIYEPIITTKNTAFNQNFGSGNTDVARGNHNHDSVYEPIITTKNSAFNQNFGSGNTDIARGDHAHNASQISFSPIGNVASTDVQQAIAELDSEKSDTGHVHNQSETHNSSDVDTALNALHHTIGTGANQAAAGNHNHDGIYEPIITVKNTAFNQNFGLGNTDIARGNHNHTPIEIGAIAAIEKGASNGIAALDATSHLALSSLSDTGTWTVGSATKLQGNSSSITSPLLTFESTGTQCPIYFKSNNRVSYLKNDNGSSLVFGAENTISIETDGLSAPVERLQITAAQTTIRNSLILESGANVSSGNLQVGGVNVSLATHNHNSSYDPIQTNNKIVLNAEFPCTVLTSLGNANTLGIMTTDFDISTKTNFYKWTSNEVVTQSYGLAIKVATPSPFQSWTNIKFRLKATSNASIDIQIYDSLGTQVLTSPKSFSVAGGWTDVLLDASELTLMNGADWSGEAFSITLQLNADSNGEAHVGSIVLDYQRL